jgi:hypothetical protein
LASSSAKHPDAYGLLVHHPAVPFLLITGDFAGFRRSRQVCGFVLCNPQPLPLMNFHCRLEFPATAAEHLRVSAALMRLLSLIAHANRFDPDSSGPATGFPYPLAVSVKPALPTSFSRQRSGFALRRFHPGTSAAYAFPRKPGLLAISTSCSAQTSGQPVRGSKALAVRPVCASKGTRLCLYNPALGFTALGACVF